MSEPRNAAGLGSLAPKLSGAALEPGDEGWDAARQAWNLAVDQQPVGVVLARGADDVRATVDFARERGLRVAPQAIGHSAGAMASLENTILLRTVPDDRRGDRRRRAPGAGGGRRALGRRWGQGRRARPGGRARLRGRCGRGRVTLGGGLGWPSRLYGLAANSVLAAEVVTADGELVRTDRDNEPDLFWALRGGGGSFGVVTALEFSLYPLTEAYAGMIAWPAERGPEVIAAYLDWIRDLPDEMTAWARFLTLPPLPEVPEPLRANPIVDVTAAFAGRRRTAPS